MFKKINTTNLKTELVDISQNVGLVLMGTAMAAGFLEYADHSRAVVPATVSTGQHDQTSNPVRRDREETGPHYVSYSASQRTPGREGKL